MKATLRLVMLGFCLVLGSALPLPAQSSITVYPNPIQFGTVPLDSPSYSVYVYVENVTPLCGRRHRNLYFGNRQR